jgi:hypothetical protein
MDSVERAMWRQIGYIFVVVVLVSSALFGG